MNHKHENSTTSTNSSRLRRERGAVGTEMAIIVAIVVAIAIAVGAAMMDTAEDRIDQISDGASQN